MDSFMDSLQGGVKFGQGIKQAMNRDKISALAGQAYGATDPAQRQAAIGQAIGLDAGQGFQVEGKLDQTEDRRTKTMVNMAKLLTTAPEQARAGLYAKMVPTLSQFGLSELPPVYDQTTAPTIMGAADSIVKALGGGVAGGRVQSTYVDSQGQRVAIMADGTQKVLGGNDAGMSQQTISIQGADGRPRQFTFDKRTGNYVPADQGGQSSALGAPQPVGTESNPLPQGGTQQIVDQIAAQANRMIASGIPEAEVDAWAASQQGAVTSPAPAPAYAPSGAFVGRTPEEEAAAVAQAKGNVELGLLPQTEAIKRESAIQQAVGIESGKNAAEKAAAAPATIATLQNSLTSIDELLADPELDSILGLGSLNPLNRVPGTDARGRIARADQIAGQAFLAAFNQLKGGGAITEREGDAATRAMARLDRSQSPADYRQSLRDLRDAISPAIDRARQAQGGLSPRAPAGRAVRRTGTLNGRKVVEYSDGTVEYGD